MNFLCLPSHLPMQRPRGAGILVLESRWLRTRSARVGGAVNEDGRTLEPRPLRSVRALWWAIGLLLGALVYFNRPGADAQGMSLVFLGFAALVVGVVGLSGLVMLLLLMRPKHGSISRSVAKARAGRVEEAIAELQREIDTRGPLPRRSSALGDCYLLLEQWREAYIQYLDAERLDGRQGRYLAKQGFALWKMGRASEAAPLLERAAAIEPLNPSHAWTACLILIDLGRIDEARHQLRLAEFLVEKLAPSNPVRRRALEDSIAICRQRLEQAGAACQEPPPAAAGGSGLNE
jgi:tetratricopeptide (TPR) repeat protein